MQMSVEDEGRGVPPDLARVRASLRRASTQTKTEPEPAILDSGDFYIELESRKITVRGAEVHLTPKEFDLLVYFVKHAGKVLTPPDVAGGGLGWRLRRAGSVLARVRG